MVLRLHLPLISLGTTAAVVAAVLMGVPAVSADTAPPSASTPKTVAADALPTPQINGVVWTQLILGNTVYVGGQFTRARPDGAAPGSNEVVRNNLLSYTLSTGVMTSWNPNANGAVRALVTNGSRVFAGGSFTTIGGINRYRLAAFDAGVLASGWAPVVNAQVKALGVSGGKLYAGGTFTTAAGASRNRIASFSTSNGAALQSWRGNPAGGTVSALTVSPDGTKVVIGGSFTSYDGGTNPGYGLAATNSTTGASLTWRVNSLVRDAGLNGAILNLTSSSAGVFGVGYDFGAGANFEGTFRASWTDGSLIWIEDCHGDTYSVVPVGDVVYTTGHAHYCGNIGGFGETDPRSYHRTLSFSMAATGTVKRNTVGNYTNFEGNPCPTLLAWYPEINTGTYTGQGQGPWNVAANSQYVLYAGEFTIVNNRRQQGLVRFAVSSIAPNKQGPRATGADFQPSLTSPSAGTIRLSWRSNYDRDNERLTYTVLRNGVAVQTLTGLSVDWKRPTMTWTNTGLSGGTTYTYQLRATDPFGNSVTGSSSSLQARTGANLNLTPNDDPAPELKQAPAPVPNPAPDAEQVPNADPVPAPVAPDAAAVQDYFEREIVDGLGSAGIGGFWTTTGPAASYAVQDGQARITSPAAGTVETAYLDSVSTTDADVRVAFTPLQAPTNDGAYVSLLGRTIAGDDYRARVHLKADGTVNLQVMRGDSALETVPAQGLTQGVGERLWLRVQVSGASPTTIQARVWAGDTEPAEWQARATDSARGLQAPGGVGLGLFLPSPADTAPLTVAFDEFEVRPTP